MKKLTPDMMSNTAYRMMLGLFGIADAVHPTVRKRALRFGILPGMSVLDYGCGPGRYSVEFARMVGNQGTVFAADIHPLAIEGVRKRIQKNKLGNVLPVSISGYECPLPDGCADRICAIDMFHMIQDSGRFLKELRRLLKDDGILVIDYGHQLKSAAIGKIEASCLWEIIEKAGDHLKCRPIRSTS